MDGAERYRVTAAIAVADVKQPLSVTERGAMLSRIRRTLADIAIAGGLMAAFLAAAAGMAIAFQAAGAARRARQQLIAGLARGKPETLPFAPPRSVASFEQI